MQFDHSVGILPLMDAHVLSFGSDFFLYNELRMSIKTQILELQPLKPKMKLQ